MKMKEILEKESTQLRNELADQQKHLFELRSQAVTEKLEDPSQLGKTKKTIARIMTILRQRELAGQDTGAQAGAAGGEGEGATDTGTRTKKPALRRTRKPAARGGKKTAAKKPAPKKKTAAKAGNKSRPATRKPAAKKAARKAKTAAK